MKIYLTLITSLSLAGTFSLFEVNQAAADTCATTGIPENRPFDGSLSGEITLCQNWTETEQQAFWFTGQGSLILPYNWFLALETTRSNTGAIEKLRSPDVMNGYRYLPQLPTELNPDGLPIGFTKDEPRGNSAYETVSAQWLGFTCAACHTGQVEFGPVKALVDGAPAMADFEGFFTEMAAALRATLEDTEKFDRFSKDVFALNQARAPAEPTDAGQLKHQLMQLTADREAWNRRNSGAHPYGHARLDAIGAIFNEIEWAARKDNSPLPAGKADAPVSYPFIWDTSQHDRVQWNGSVANAGLGAISRNMGEVLGVFGALELTTSRLSRLGHRNSINIANLGKLETLIWSLQSPKWSDMQSLIEASDLPNADKDLWTIDPDLAAIGAKLFNGQNTETAAFACASCHTPVKRDDPNRRVKATMIRLAKVGTDTTMAENFRTRQTDAHDLKKLFKSYWGFLSKYKRFEEEAVSAEMLKYSVVGVLTRELFNQPLTTVEAIKAGQPPAVISALESAQQEHLGRDIKLLKRADRKPAVVKFLRKIGRKFDETQSDYCNPITDPCYKARPLNGIWATAPYLHNGSVRTIRQLLQPSKREASFFVGSRTYDPKDLGFISEADNSTRLDTSLPGNANAGHDFYGDYFERNPDALNALLEYLKTL